MVNDISLALATDRTTTLIRDILSRNAGAKDFQPDEALVDIGLTSLDLVNLMMAVEAEFDILIPPTHLNLKNFYSTATVARMILAVLSTENSFEIA